MHGDHIIESFFFLIKKKGKEQIENKNLGKGETRWMDANTGLVFFTDISLHRCYQQEEAKIMATKALAFTLSLNDCFGSKSPHTASKVSVFSVRCSAGNLPCSFLFHQ